MTNFSTTDKIVLKKYYSIMEDIVSTLKKKNKINKNYESDLKKYHEILHWVNWTHENFNLFDGVVRNDERKKIFLKNIKQFEFNEFNLGNMWDLFVVISFLRQYWAIETGLGVLLLNVKYGAKPNEKVKGKETLGDFKIIFKNLGIYDKFFWEDVDTGFRNALAHGWYLVKKQRFVYYGNSKLENPKELDQVQLAIKLRTLFHISLSILGVVGKWEKLEEIWLCPDLEHE